MKNFRTFQLAKQLLEASKSVQLKEPYRDQFNRAVLSIALNLAEGSAKMSNKERRKFYEIELGSLRETQVIIDVMELTNLKDIADKTGASLYKLCLSLRH